MNIVASSEQRRRREAQDLLALDIQRGDEDISISIRSVIERGYSDTFKESLDANLKKKTSEIERISARHYSDFLMSTRSMFEIRGAAEEIGGVVKEINVDLTESGNELVEVLTELEKYQSEREKTRVVFEDILRCKELSELMQRSRKDYEAKDYYAALRSIILLRDKACQSPKDRSLPQPMIDILSSWWPDMSRKIYEAVVFDADALLDKLRENVMIIGQVALKRQAMVALGASKYSLLTVSTSAASSAAAGDAASPTGGGRDYINTPGGSSYAPSVMTAASGSDPREGLSTEDYKSLFSRLPLLYRAPSFSLQQVKRCLHALRLHSWARGGDLDAWLSLRFTAGQRARGKEGGSARRRRSARMRRPSRGSIAPSSYGGGDSGDGGGDSSSQTSSARRSPVGVPLPTSATSRRDGHHHRRSPVPDGTHSPTPSSEGTVQSRKSPTTSFQEASQTDYLHPVSEADEEYFDGITEGLGPLFCALHVCEVLQQLPTLYTRIRERRATALEGILRSNEEKMRMLSLTDKGALSDYVSELVGFFVLESLVATSVRTAGDSYSLAAQSAPLTSQSGIYQTFSHAAPFSGGGGSSTRGAGTFAMAAISEFCGHGEEGSFARAEARLGFLFAPCDVEARSGTDTVTTGSGNGDRPGIPGITATSYLSEPFQEESEDGSFAHEELLRLWHHASMALDALLAKQVHSLRAPEQLMVVKDEVCLMSETFADPATNLPCHALSETTRLLWTQFEELQLKSAKEAVINLLFTPAAFCPLVLDSYDDYCSLVLGLDLDAVTSLHAAIDRAVRERQTREGGAHMGRGAAVLAAAQSVNKAVAREIVAGSIPPGHSLGATISGPMGPLGGDTSTGGADKGLASKEVTPRQRASVLLGNLDALEEDALGDDAHGGAPSPARVSQLQRPESGLVGSGTRSQSPHSETPSVLTPLTDRSRLSSFSSDGVGSSGRGLSREGGAHTPPSRYGSGGSSRGGASEDNYPPGMHFSQLVPGVQRFMYMYVTRLVGFAAKNPPLGDVCESACSLLLRAQECTALAMTDEIHRAAGELPMNKACQICVDAAALAIASRSVWGLLRASLHTLNWYRDTNTKLTAMFADAERAGRMMYMKVSLLAQSSLFDAVKGKTLELLDSVLYIEYLPTTLPRSAHEGITDIVSFLEAKMDTLSSLPRSSRDIAQFTACNAIAEGLLSHLLSPQVKAINVLTLAALDLDCRRMTQYAHATGVPSLNQCFAEAHEIIQASIHPDVAKLSSDDRLRKRLFPRMDPVKLAALLEKVQPLESGVPSASLPRHSRAVLLKACEQLRRRPSGGGGDGGGRGGGGTGREREVETMDI